MQQKTESNNFLLSLALFKKLYDEKKDIYEIIKLLISHELSNNNSITEFSLTDMTLAINRKYGFEIPQAVVKTTLNKIKKSGKLELKGGKYLILEGFEPVIEISEPDSDINAYIIGVLSKHINKTKTLTINVIEKSLESFFLKKSDKYNVYPYIESCILKESNNAKFSDGLNKIKYGLILYESISCGIEDINPSKWSEKIIFLDTEVLFYLTSYNGELFKKISQDFLDLIIKIVNKEKKIISLRFFEDVKKELDGIFDVAESIIRKKIPKQPNDVISYILKGCKNSSDIVSMKTGFYAELSKQGIQEYRRQVDYSNHDNYQYNLENESNLDDKGQKHLEQLSHINILRNGHKYKTLDKVKYLFLTETRDTIKKSIENKDQDDFPLALSLFDLTNQLWIKTNKGLGDANLPATFDIRNQARIALSSSLGKKVSEEFDKVLQQHQDESIDKQTCIDRIADLREKEILPDNINALNCEDITSLILDPDSIAMHYEEKAHYKEESNRKGREIASKDLELKGKTNEIDRLKKADIDRKSKNKKTVKIILCLLVISILFYFKNEILDVIPFLLFGEIIFYVVTSVSAIFAILTYFDIDRHKIMLHLVKK